MVTSVGVWDAGYTDSYEDEGTQGICLLWSLKENYDAVSNLNNNIMAWHKDADHGEMLSYSDGYLTAWFMYWLKGKMQADFF